MVILNRAAEGRWKCQYSRPGISGNLHWVQIARSVTLQVLGTLPAALSSHVAFALKVDETIK